MIFSGETVAFIEGIDFNGKAELYERLTAMKTKSAGLAEPDRTIAGEMITAAMQEIFDGSEREFMDYKQYLKRN
jgi:hypothetical protein